MKELFEMNKPFKKYLPLYMIMLSIVLLMGTSYALLRSSHQGENTYTMNVGTLQVTFVDSKTSALTLENAYPMTDDEGMKNSAELVFTVKNTGNVAAKYSVYIEETSTNPEFKSVIRFISNKNDTGYTDPKTLASDKYIDDNGTLSVGAEATYKVKAWISSDADSTYMNKTFTARIVVDSVQLQKKQDSAACFAYEEITFYKYKKNMTDTELSACASFVENNFVPSLNEGDTYEDFCQGKINDMYGLSIEDFFTLNRYKELANLYGEELENFTTKINGISVTGFLDYENDDVSQPECPKNVSVPDTINDLPVIHISNQDRSYITTNKTSITLPNNLLEIADGTFSGASIKHIEFPDSLEIINDSAFDNAGLTGELNISGNVKLIGGDAFRNNELTKVVIGDNVSIIDNGSSGAFANNQITEIKIGKGIKAINAPVFLKDDTSNPNLSKITIDKTCTDIKKTMDLGETMEQYPWLSQNEPYTATGVTIYGLNGEVCDSF